MLRLFLLGLFGVQFAAGVIHRLTSLEYLQMPTLMSIDDYTPCMQRPEDVYCFTSAQLYGNLSDPVYNLLVEYSANKITHFDHTHLHRGVCVGKCLKLIKGSPNLTETVEACLNYTLAQEYRLTAKIYQIMCDKYEESSQYNLDSADYAFAAILLSLIGLNILGSLYDFFCAYGKESFGGNCLLCFSVRANWRRLVAPGSPSPKQRRIKVVFGYRSITALLVVMGHAPIPSLITGNNPHYLEETYHNLIYHLLYNGTLIVQTFFIISGFLTAYNILLSEERRPPNWQNLPKAILMRWLRLTPPYALVMFYVMTWARHLSAGPFHMIAVQSEADACWKDWWLHLLYVHNYKDRSQCMAHAWYLAADFQLSVVGLALFCLLYSSRARKLAIGALVVVGLLTPAVHTYVQNLHAVLVVSPEVALNFFVNDPTFNNLYKRGHTNLVCYGLGLAMAYAVMNLKESDIGSEKFKKYRIFYWMLVPIMLTLVFIGFIFFIDGIEIPIGVRVVYSSVIKMLFGFMNVLFMYFTIVKVDSVFRAFLNWAGWARISRMTYVAYLVHVPILRFATASYDEPIHMSAFWNIQNYFSNLCISYVFAVPLFLLVESPLAEFIKTTLVPQPRPEKTKPVTMVGDIMTSKDTIEVKL